MFSKISQTFPYILSYSFYRMPNHGFPFFGNAFSGIKQIDFMVQSAAAHIVFIAVVYQIGIHRSNGGRLVVISPMVHHLNA